MFECARAVGAAYLQMSQAKNIDGDLLNANAENYKVTNLAEATVNADTFGLSMLGDGAIIKNGVVQCHGA